MEFTYEFIVGHPHENFIIYKNTDRIYYFIDDIEKLAFRLPQSPPNMSPDAKKKFVARTSSLLLDLDFRAYIDHTKN